MTEQDFWTNHVKVWLHQPKAGRVAWKVQDAYNSGMPDVDFVCGANRCAKIELKYIDAWPVKPNTPTRRLMPSSEQQRHLAEWEEGGGLSLMLIGVGDEWFLIHHSWLYPEEPFRSTIEANATLRGTFRRNGRWKTPEGFQPIIDLIATENIYGTAKHQGVD